MIFDTHFCRRMARSNKGVIIFTEYLFLLLLATHKRHEVTEINPQECRVNVNIITLHFLQQRFESTPVSVVFFSLFSGQFEAGGEVGVRARGVGGGVQGGSKCGDIKLNTLA